MQLLREAVPEAAGAPRRRPASAPPSTTSTPAPCTCPMASGWRPIRAWARCATIHAQVHVKMRGATPPHTYALSEREALFHGVQSAASHPGRRHRRRARPGRPAGPQLHARAARRFQRLPSPSGTTTSSCRPICAARSSASSSSPASDGGSGSGGASAHAPLPPALPRTSVSARNAISPSVATSGGLVRMTLSA